MAKRFTVRWLLEITFWFALFLALWRLNFERYQGVLSSLGKPLVLMLIFIVCRLTWQYPKSPLGPKG